MAETSTALPRPLLTRHSPLEHRAHDMERAGRAGPCGAELREVPFLTQFNLRLRYPAPPVRPEPLLASRPFTLPRTPNTVHRAGDMTAIWLGPDEWLVVTPGPATDVEGSLRKAAEAALCGAYADVSAHSTVLRLSGGRAREVLRKVCSIDLHPRTFGSDRCAQTLLARVRVLLVADCRADTFLIFVRASFADYVTDWLLDAMAEFADGTDHLTEER